MTGDREGCRGLVEVSAVAKADVLAFQAANDHGAAAMNLHDSSAAVAFGLGLWTAVQPCPMTANLAAVSYLGRRAGSPGERNLRRAALLRGADDRLRPPGLPHPGRHRLGLAAVEWLQQHVNQILGPVWILAAMVLWT